MDYGGEKASGDGTRTLYIGIIEKFLTDPTNPATWIISSAGIGPITRGMTAAQADASGIPGISTDSTYGCPEGYAALNASPGGLNYCALESTAEIEWVGVMEDSGPHTALGIHIGDTLNDAKQACPGSQYSQALGESPDAVTWQSNGVSFTLDAAGDASSGLSDAIDSIVVGTDFGLPNGPC
jgi:hypothetical protein